MCVIFTQINDAKAKEDLAADAREKTVDIKAFQETVDKQAKRRRPRLTGKASQGAGDAPTLQHCVCLRLSRPALMPRASATP